MAIIGIDGGRSGGIARLVGRHAEAWPLDTYKDRLGEIVKPGDTVVIEAASQVFGTAAGPMRAPFAYVWSIAHAAGFCAGRGAVVHLVPVHRWQKFMYMGVAGEGKERSINAAKALFPLVSLLATGLSRKPHDGMADALLIAAYGRDYVVGAKAG